MIWADGALVVSVGSDTIVLDAPPAADLEAIASVLPYMRAIVLTSGRLSSVGGLLPLLCALEPHRGEDAALTLHLPAGDERGAAIAEVWVRGWPDRYPLVIDAVQPGAEIELGPILARSWPLATAEIVRGEVRPMTAVGLQLQTPDLSVTYLRGAADPRAIARWLAVDLAILEVGAQPWPKTERPWRLRADEASKLGALAGEVWLVTDDGSGPDEIS